MTSATPPSPRTTRRLAVWAVALVLVFAALVALGVWQVQRLAWKEALIARVDQHRHAAPLPAPSADSWAALERQNDEYRRVSLTGHYAAARSALVTATTELGSGYWLLTPLRRDDATWVWVNRGFVPSDAREQALRDATHLVDEQHITGLLRFTEPVGGFLRRNDPALDRWYSRDVAALSAREGLDVAVAPYFIDQAATATAAPGGWPRAGLTVVHFSNNHRFYAATWFALAAMAACALGYLVLDERRLRSLAESPGLAHARH